MTGGGVGRCAALDAFALSPDGRGAVVHAVFAGGGWHSVGDAFERSTFATHMSAGEYVPTSHGTSPRLADVEYHDVRNFSGPFWEGSSEGSGTMAVYAVSPALGSTSISQTSMCAAGFARSPLSS